MGSSNTQFAVIVSSKIKSVADLAAPGTKIGVSQGSGGQYFLYAFAKAHKLDYSKLQIVFVAPNGMVGAFRNGEVDAMFTWEPIASMGTKTVSGAHLLAHGGDNGVFQTQQYIVVNQHIWAKPEIVRPFLETLVYTGDWVESNKKEAVAILCEFLQTETSTFETTIAGYDYRVKFTQAQVDQLKEVYKFIRTMNPTSAEIADWSFIDPAPLRTIDAARVSVQKV
jgi:NitT/TauT family transport system substrate-binding protein